MVQKLLVRIVLLASALLCVLHEAEAKPLWPPTWLWKADVNKTQTASDLEAVSTAEAQTNR
jgi:hypothetical protein